MRPRRFISIAAASACCALACACMSAPSALAGTSQVVADCNTHGRLTQQYTVGALQDALSTMPAQVKEYTNCYDVIDKQLLGQIKGVHTATVPHTSSGGSFLPAPVIVVLVALLLAAAGLGSMAVRRRRS